MTIRVVLDGREIATSRGTTIQGVVRSAGMPDLGICSPLRPGYSAPGACRLCLVEVDGIAGLVPACRTPVRDTMVIRTRSDRVSRIRMLVGELTRAEQTNQAAQSAHGTRLDDLLKQLGVNQNRFGFREPNSSPVSSNGAIRFDPDACVRCGACRSACRDVQVNDVIGFAGSGNEQKVIFDGDVSLQQSSCVSCGECVEVCPTAALSTAGVTPKSTGSDAQTAETICPYCSVGCQLSVRVAGNAIVDVQGGPGPANQGRLCVKGRFGLEVLSHVDRLRYPLLRRPESRKLIPPNAIAAEVIAQEFRPASWDEALDAAAAGLAKVKSQHGGGALAVLGSAKAANEDAYVLQKFARSVLDTSHVDHCTRLCASVPPLAEAIGFSAVTAPVEEVQETDVILMVGSNPEVNHPVAATFIKNAVRAGRKLILVDPYHQPFARHATHHLALWPGTDVTLLSAMLNVIISEQLWDEDFVRRRVDGFEEVATAVAHATPEHASSITGVAASEIRAAARLFACAGKAMTFWGMGASQHVHGADNIRCVIALALLCGHVGKPGSGLHPLRGQNNVQGSCDAGLIPTTLPGYRLLGDEMARAELAALWGRPPPATPGLTVCEIIDAAQAQAVRGLYVAGGNPAMANPDLERTRQSLTLLDFLVVQDILPSETAALADVILPAAAIAEREGTYTSTDRWLQRAGAVLSAPGEAKPDWWITSEIAARMGAGWRHNSVGDVFDEMATVVPILRGVTWDALNRERSVRVPVNAAHSASLFETEFPTASGRARIKAVKVREPGERPDSDYPFVLVTGRVREHWHTGTMTRRSPTLQALAPHARIGVSSVDFDRMLLTEGAIVQVETRRGRVRVRCSRDDRLQAGVLFIPFSFHEAAANELTASHLDPTTRVPEYKLSAARLVLINSEH